MYIYIFYSSNIYRIVQSIRAFNNLISIYMQSSVREEKGGLFHAKNIARALTLPPDEIFFNFVVYVMEFMGWLFAEWLLH